MPKTAEKVNCSVCGEKLPERDRRFGMHKECAPKCDICGGPIDQEGTVHRRCGAKLEREIDAEDGNVVLCEFCGKPVHNVEGVHKNCQRQWQKKIQGKNWTKFNNAVAHWQHIRADAQAQGPTAMREYRRLYHQWNTAIFEENDWHKGHDLEKQAEKRINNS